MIVKIQKCIIQNLLLQLDLTFTPSEQRISHSEFAHEEDILSMNLIVKWKWLYSGLLILQWFSRKKAVSITTRWLCKTTLNIGLKKEMKSPTKYLSCLFEIKSHLCSDFVYYFEFPWLLKITHLHNWDFFRCDKLDFLSFQDIQKSNFLESYYVIHHPFVHLSLQKHHPQFS